MNWQTYVLIGLIIGAMMALRTLGKKKGEDGRAARMMKKYRHMTKEIFDAIPEGERTDAVVCRLLGKAEQERTDPVRLLSALGNGTMVVYSVWVICKEMAADGFATLMKSRSRDMAEPATDGFAAIGATACGEALTAMRAAFAERNDEVLATAEAAFRRAVQTECPLSLCEEYIRDHEAEYLDED